MKSTINKNHSFSLSTANERKLKKIVTPQRLVMPIYPTTHPLFILFPFSDYFQKIAKIHTALAIMFGWRIIHVFL